MTSDRRIRLLVAEDDAGLRDIFVGLLDDLGYDVVAALADGSAVVERCLTDEPDLVILDHRMPGKSGAEVARELREALPSLPVIMLSAYDDESLQHAAAQFGVRDYLVKGCTAADIVAAIERATRVGL